MKISYDGRRNATFSSLECGTCFMYKREAYIKMRAIAAYPNKNIYFNAVLLYNGEPQRFIDTALVTPYPEARVEIPKGVVKSED